jgi:hypothetical protein
MRHNCDDIWSLVRQDFTERLPRRTAIIVREDDWELSFAYPTDFGRIGWLFDCALASSYREKPVLCISFAEYSYGDEPWETIEKNTFHFSDMSYSPSVVQREVLFSNMGLKVNETFCQASNGGFVWDLRCECLSHSNHPFRKKMVTVLSMADPQCVLSVSDGQVAIEYIGENGPEGTATRGIVHICSDFDKVFAYASIDDLLQDAADGQLGAGAGKGRHIVFVHRLELSHGDCGTIRFGLSLSDAQRSQDAFEDRSPVDTTRSRWNEWFLSLPPIETSDLDEINAYYKCWMVTRLNNYLHPTLGRTMIEALPVYRGYWQWALTGYEIVSDLNPELGPEFIKRLIDLFLQCQCADGYVTHAIYLEEETPGELWAKRSIIQTPHIPWIGVRYYNKTGDESSLARWYPVLRKYYDYICESRDTNFLNLHLWAILASYDTGLDTAPAFEKVTYGEDGIKERFCYPAIFAAERVRYEQAMGKISSILNNGDEDFWKQQANTTMDAMNHHLWDCERNWYGVIHEDNTLDTRIGLDGLFAFAYGLVDHDRANAARENFRSLIGNYGIHTLAPGEPGFHAGIYWRGPAWSKSISTAAVAAVNYYPELIDSIRQSAVRFALQHPNIWECMNAQTGVIARGDLGMYATPAISSNVGAAELLGALLLMRGKTMFDF